MKFLNIILILIVSVFFTACVRGLDSNGLTLNIEESELNKTSDKFPLERNFVFAKVSLEQPYIYIPKNTNRLNAKANMDLSAIFIPNANGVFELSGVPYFNKDKSAIFLKDIKIDDLKFTNLSLDKTYINLLISNMNPVFDTIFENIPIYEINKSSFKGSFVKDIKIEDSELLVTFGL